MRELDERLGLSALVAANIMDDRRGKNTQLPLPDLLRQSIYSRLVSRIRRCERRRAAVARSDFPVDRFAEDLVTRGSLAFAPPSLHCEQAKYRFTIVALFLKSKREIPA